MTFRESAADFFYKTDDTVVNFLEWSRLQCYYIPFLLWCKYKFNRYIMFVIRLFILTGFERTGLGFYFSFQFTLEHCHMKAISKLPCPFLDQTRLTKFSCSFYLKSLQHVRSKTSTESLSTFCFKLSISKLQQAHFMYVLI